MFDPNSETPLTERANDLRFRMSEKLCEFAQLLDEAYASGFLVHFGIAFDEGSERFVTQPIRLTKEF